MPLINTFGALKEQNFSVARNPGYSDNWLNAISLKVSNPNVTGSTRVKNKYMANQIWEYGYELSTSGTGTQRAYVVNFTESNGNLNFYKVFQDQPSIGSDYTRIVGIEKDTSNNLHILTDSYILLKYNSSNVFSIGYTFTEATNIGTPVNLIRDSNNYLYIISYVSTYIIIAKIDPSTYSVVWSNKITLSVTDCNIYIDNSNNLYAMVWSTTGSTTSIIKLDTSGSIIWQQSNTSFTGSVSQSFAFDSKNRIYMLNPTSTVAALVKLDTDGSTIFTKTVTTVAGIGTYIGLVINSDDEIVLFQEYPGGAVYYTYTCALTNDGVALNSTRIGAGSPFILYDYWATNNGHLYIKGYTSNSSMPIIMIKVPNRNDVLYNTAYSFTVTNDDSTVTTTSSSLITDNITNPTVSTTTITFSTTAYSTTGVTLSTTSYTPTLGATVPFSYSIALV